MNLKDLFELNSIQLTIDQLSQLDAYRAYLLEYTQNVNLISRSSTEHIDTTHLLDTAVPAALLPGSRTIVDLGSGGGLPGIVLAILMPEVKIILSESKEKKIKFLQSCRTHLNLKNLEVFNPSRQKIQTCADLVVSRAFGTLADIAAEASKYLVHGGCIAAYKGREDVVKQELQELSAAYSTEVLLYTLLIPDQAIDQSIERRLVLLRRSAETQQS